MTRDDILELNPNAVFWDDLDNAIIGVAERPNLNMVVAYDKSRAVDIIVQQMTVTDEDLTPDDIRNGVTAEDKRYEMGLDYFDFNILNAWVGDETPVFLTTVQ